jgi:hypothetical protein
VLRLERGDVEVDRGREVEELEVRHDVTR